MNGIGGISGRDGPLDAEAVQARAMSSRNDVGATINAGRVTRSKTAPGFSPDMPTWVASV